MLFRSDAVIQHKAVSGMITKAQGKIEGNNYGIRKNLMDYDVVNNQQRELIYNERRMILQGTCLSDLIEQMMQDVSVELSQCCRDDLSVNAALMQQNLQDIISTKYAIGKCSKFKNVKVVQAYALAEMTRAYDEHIKGFSDEEIKEIERYVLLRTIDSYWTRHIDDMEQLRQNISLIGYGQKDPVVEYKIAAYDMFDSMFKHMMVDVLHMFFRAKLVENIEKVS